MKRRWEYNILIHTLVVHFKLSEAFIVQFIVDRACISKRNNRRYGTILFYELKNDQRMENMDKEKKGEKEGIDP